MDEQDKEYWCVEKEHVVDVLREFTPIGMENLTDDIINNVRCYKDIGINCKTLDNFKRTCGLGDAIFVKWNGTYALMQVSKICDNRDRITLGCYDPNVEMPSKYDFSGLDADFMENVKKIYPNGDGV